MPNENWQAERLPYNCDLPVLFLRPYRWRRFVAKFAVSDFAARIRDVKARAQCDRSEQHD